MLQYSGIYLQLFVCLKTLASSKHLGWRKEVTNHVRGGKRKMRISITNYVLGSPTPKRSWCYTGMRERKFICVKLQESHSHYFRAAHIQNLHEHYQLWRSAPKILTSDSCISSPAWREVWISFLQILQEYLANIFTHHKHLLSVSEMDQEKAQSSFPNKFYTGRYPIINTHGSKET